MTSRNKSGISSLTVTEQQAGRRIDNVLSGHYRDIPRARIYRMIRKGEVRVNSKRVKQDYRLQLADAIRLPPVREIARPSGPVPPAGLQRELAERIIYQNGDLLVLDKPAGLAVHSGSRQRFGIIEAMRALLPDEKNLELVHRLDKETSGCLLLAKNHPVLRELQETFREKRVHKEYLALLRGPLERKRFDVDLRLERAGSTTGDRSVRVSLREGKAARTRFLRQRNFTDSSLVRAVIETGRTHQIRSHAAHLGHPVAGDTKYGDFEFNRKLKREGLKRMFLHAESITLPLPGARRQLAITAPLPAELATFLDRHR